MKLNIELISGLVLDLLGLFAKLNILLHLQLLKTKTDLRM
jgi:hypothetical protein